MKDIARKYQVLQLRRDIGHLTKNCPEEKKRTVKSKETIPKTKTMELQVGLIDGHEKELAMEPEKEDESLSEEDVYWVDLRNELEDNFQRQAELQVKGDNHIQCIARINIGYPITLIKKDLIENIAIKIPDPSWNRYLGINNSPLKIL